MIKSKSLFDSVDKVFDGTRIIVAGGFPDGYELYDEWFSSLAPTKKLLYDYKYHDLSWEQYEVRFFKLMEGHRAQNSIQELAHRSSVGEIITLLCWERSDEYCHRRLVKSCIDRGGNNDKEHRSDTK